ncbi:MAG: glycosyltransferase family 2 protein [Acidobacteriota bacterium]
MSVLVLNHNGRAHLAECLPTLEAQTYPRELIDIVVVDNGSSDDSLAFVAGAHPRARVIAFDDNRGFAAPYNDAVRRCEAPLIAFLNNDTRVAPEWLDELVSALIRYRAASAGSRMLDWTGERIDFGGGIVSFIGHSWQRDEGQPSSIEHGEEPLLFACGGSMIVDRAVFLDAGGFDESFFAYFEDVDLGWRLNLLGHQVVFAPRAVTWHRGRGTASRWALAPRLRLYERNALAMIYKNYSDETLERVAPVAITLALSRALAGLDIDPALYLLGRRPPERAGVPARTIAQLIALEDFGSRLADLSAKRQLIQARRRRSDQELWPLFGDPLRLHETGGTYERVARALIADFGIAAMIAGDVATTAPAAESSPAPVPAVDRLADGRVPMVTIVILTALGATHLPECLASIAAQRHPPDRCEVIVVDNGSTEDPTPAVERAYPGARVIRNHANLGFAAANNIGANAAQGDYLVFLNDDTRVHPDWLSELLGVAARHGAACVGCRILDWDGKLIDFCGGSVNFEGRGFQHHVGDPAGLRPGQEAPLLFACGAAMLVARDVFLDAGGWDEGTFAYYEDVELGWRLWLLGHEVWFAPGAVIYHKHHGTSGRWPEPPRLRLLERNALRMVYTHLEQTTLGRTLPAALLLAADRPLLATAAHRGYDEVSGNQARHGWRRALRPLHWLRSRVRPRRLRWLARHALSTRGARKELPLLVNLKRVGAAGCVSAGGYLAREIWTGSLGDVNSRASYLIERGGQPASFDAHAEPIPASAAAALLGIRDFLDSLPELSLRRQALQARRRRSDAEIIGRFGDYWMSPVASPRQDDHIDLQEALVKAFGVPRFRQSRSGGE